MAAQPIKTNNIKAMIDKTEETVNVECVEKLKREQIRCYANATSQPKRSIKDDMIGLERRSIRKYVEDMEQRHKLDKPEVVMENNKCKILWDFIVQKDHEIYGRRTDATVVQKDKNLCQKSKIALLALIMEELIPKNYKK